MIMFGHLQIVGLAAFFCLGYVKGGYNAPVGLVSQAGASSRYSGVQGSQARANVGTLSSNSNAGDGSEADNSEDDSQNGGSVIAANAGPNGGSSYASNAAGVRIVGPGAGPGSPVPVDLSQNGGNSGFQVLTVDTGSLNDIGAQIQFTIRNILNKFGIQMQQSGQGLRSSFQPGQTYLYRNNGMPAGNYMNQGQYMGGNQAQYMAGNQGSRAAQSGSQYQYQSGQPIAVSYKYVGQPGQSSSAVAFQVSAQGNQGLQSEENVPVSGSFNVPVNNGRASVTYTGVKPQVTVYNSNNDADNSQDSGSGIYSGSSSQGQAGSFQAAAGDNNADNVVASNNAGAVNSGNANAYSGSQRLVNSNQAAAATHQKVKYAASNNQKSESSSNVAYESSDE